MSEPSRPAKAFGSSEPKRERVYVRLDAESKRVLERAAQYQHTTVTRFVLGSALEAAEAIVAQAEEMPLTSRDWQAFMDALDRPPKPNTRLRELLAGHGER